MRALVLFGGFRRPRGRGATVALLAAGPDVDAVFAASDLMAFGAIEALRAHGRRIPEDVAVVGFDNAPAAARHLPPLTTVEQPVEQMGRLMVRMLLARISGELVEDRYVALPTRLVLRETA